MIKLNIIRLVPLTDEEIEQRDKKRGRNDFDYGLNLKDHEYQTSKVSSLLDVEITEAQWEAIKKEVLKVF
jgi:hypothetical protein